MFDCTEDSHEKVCREQMSHAARPVDLLGWPFRNVAKEVLVDFPVKPSAPKAEKKLPRVSIIVPCYNYGHFLSACVESILGQEGVDIDVLIIDDASPDRSWEVAERLVEQDSRISLIRHEVNRGHIATYNEGIKHIQGDYVVLLSADDMLTRGSLARATAVMEAYPSVGLVYGNPFSFHGTDLPEPKLHLRSWSVWKGHEWIAAQCRRGLSCIYSPEALVRTRIQKAVGGYSAELPHSADLEMWLRIASVSDIARVNGSDQAFRRIHSASMMQTGFASVYSDLRERQHTYERFFKGPGKDLPNAEHCLSTVKACLAEDALGAACDLLAKEGENTDVDELIQLAGGIADRLADIRAWQELCLLRLKDRSAKDSVKLRWLMLRREIRSRVRWRRWRWSGI